MREFCITIAAMGMAWLGKAKLCRCGGGRKKSETTAFAICAN